MFIQPIYNILLLPDVTYFFKKDFFADRADELETGSDILFLFLKNEIADGIPASDAFYPVGLSAKVENISEEDVLQVRTTDRVEISDPSVEDGEIHVSFVLRPSVEDMGEDEQQTEFTELRTALLRFVQGYQWGLWARGYILQRKNMNDMASALSEYLNLTQKRNIRSSLWIRSERDILSLNAQSMNLWRSRRCLPKLRKLRKAIRSSFTGKPP